MASRRVFLSLLLRVVLIFGVLLLAAGAIAVQGAVLPGALIALLGLPLVWELVGYLNQVNLVVARIFDSLGYGDFSPGLPQEAGPLGLASLDGRINRAMERFRSLRKSNEDSLRYLRTVIDHAPVPLISIRGQGELRPLNNAARRFLGRRSGSADRQAGEIQARIRDLAATIRPGGRELVTLPGDSGPIRAVLGVTETVTTQGREKLVAVQNLSSELAVAEFEAWHQLVRVLTHEIMNSLTPVASLSETARGLLDQADDDPAALQDAREAVETVARRSAALMTFVENYRRLSSLPKPERTPVDVAALFERMQRLAGAELDAQGIILDIGSLPKGLEIMADSGQIEQVLINLINNAGAALQGVPGGRIRLDGQINDAGRGVIAVSDNGPGIPEEIRTKVFVPFFTTRHGGSGIGLALARQVMIAHGGEIHAGRSGLGGACMTLTF